MMKTSALKRLATFFCVLAFSCNQTSAPVSQNIAADKDSMLNDQTSKITEADGTSPHQDNKLSFQTFENLDIMDNDMGIMSATQAADLAASLGNGWRLPNSEELNAMYRQADHLKNLNCNYYWGLDLANEPEEDGSLAQSFVRQSVVSGEQVNMQSNEEINSVYGVRLVRDHH